MSDQRYSESSLADEVREGYSSMWQAFSSGVEAGLQHIRECCAESRKRQGCGGKQ